VEEVLLGSLVKGRRLVHLFFPFGLLLLETFTLLHLLGREGSSLFNPQQQLVAF
jgi:hypothetical protein